MWFYSVLLTSFSFVFTCKSENYLRDKSVHRSYRYIMHKTNFFRILFITVLKFSGVVVVAATNFPDIIELLVVCIYLKAGTQTKFFLSLIKLNYSVMSKKSKNKDVTLEEEVKNITLEDQELSYEEKLNFVSVIAKPMATKSQAKRLYKLIKKASKEKGFLRSGLKDVQRRIRLGERGLCIFAGNVSPIDIMCHMPAVCEDKKIPYCYTPSRQDLGTAMGVKRGSVMVLVKPHESYQKLYDEMFQELQLMPIPVDEKADYVIPQGKI